MSRRKPSIFALYPAQVHALRKYARINGHFWRLAIAKDWEAASYPSCPELAADLQQARNIIGPSRLDLFPAFNLFTSQTWDDIEARRVAAQVKP